MKQERVMVIGASGTVGRLLVARLTEEGKRVIGVDRRRWHGPRPPGFEFHRGQLTKRPFEDLFRQAPPTTIAHVGLVSSQRVDMEERYEHNVVGMQRLVALCRRHGVRRLVLLSRGTVYGADLRNPVYLDEDAPLRGASRHSELRDIVEADVLAQSLSMRTQSLSTAILRPANIVGPSVRNTIVAYLRLPIVPTLMGYDPMIQLVHEADVVHALRLALDATEPGVYNLPGPCALPLSVVIRQTGGRPFPVLATTFYPVMEALWRAGLSPAPMPHPDYLRYPCLLSGARAQASLGYVPEHDMDSTLAAVRARPRPGWALKAILLGSS